MNFFPFHFLTTTPPDRFSSGVFWHQKERHTIYYDLDCDRSRTEDLARYLLFSPYENSEEIQNLLRDPTIDINARVAAYFGSYAQSIPLIHFAALIAPHKIVTSFLKNKKLDTQASVEGFSPLRALAHFPNMRSHQKTKDDPVRETALVLHAFLSDPRFALRDSELNLAPREDETATDVSEVLVKLDAQNKQLFAYTSHLLTERVHVIARRSICLLETAFLDVLQGYKKSKDPFPTSMWNPKTKKKEKKHIADHIYYVFLAGAKKYMAPKNFEGKTIAIDKSYYPRLETSSFLPTEGNKYPADINKTEQLHACYVVANYLLQQGIDFCLKESDLTKENADLLFGIGLMQIKEFFNNMLDPPASAFQDKLIVTTYEEVLKGSLKHAPIPKKMTSRFHNKIISFRAKDEIKDGPS